MTLFIGKKEPIPEDAGMVVYAGDRLFNEMRANPSAWERRLMGVDVVVNRAVPIPSDPEAGDAVPSNDSHS